ncbi:MAG: MFS transporter [Dehalococcoidia bacterium]|nr:MFS transporter [Dehalococcoidia bacterium]
MTELLDPRRRNRKPRGPQPGEPSDGEYNLAERVYGPRTQPRSPESNGARYNLAERVHGGGPPRSSIAALTATASVTAAVSVAAPPRRGDPPPAATAVGAGEPSSGLSLRAFESLRIPAFRWYSVSALAMYAALMTEMLVRGIIVFDLTGSFSALGTLALASAVPGLALSFHGGVLADRFSRKYVVQVGQGISAVTSLIVGLLLFFDQLRVAHLMAAAVVHGIMLATMMPARQALIPEIVGRRYLMSAIPLNSAGMNFMSLFAPTLGGFAVALYGGEWAYFGIAAAYIIATVAMFPIATRPAADANLPGAEGTGGEVGRITRGLIYVWRTPAVSAVLVVSFLTSLLAMPYRMMLPGFVVEVFHAGAAEVSVLNGIAAAGSLVGALAIASMAEGRRGQLLLGSAALIGVGLVAFAFSGGLLIGGACMLVIGLGSAGRQALVSVLLQTHAQDAYRGRVMSIYMAQFQLMAFGTFFVGKFSDAFGAVIAFAGLGVGLVLLSILLWVAMPRIRRME